MENKYDDLVPFVKKYKEEIAAVEIRRKLWHEEKKALIEKTLTEFIETHQLPCSVKSDDSILNQEGVFLSFNDTDTGIVIKANNQKLFQTGGGLVYHQNANGKIAAVIILPYIENIKGQKGDRKDIEIIKPEDLDEKLILSHIIKFFKETLEWECFLRQMIGFNH